MLHVLDLPELRQVVLLPVLNLTLVWNRGVTFGLLNGFGAWSHLVLARGGAGGGRGARRLAARGPRRPLVAVALGAIAGGAIGNVIDRLRFGAVVDFIHAHVGDWSLVCVQRRRRRHRLRRRGAGAGEPSPHLPAQAPARRGRSNDTRIARNAGPACAAADTNPALLGRPSCARRASAEVLLRLTPLHG